MSTNIYEIQSILWRISERFRNEIPSSKYNIYILAILFLKYVSDMWNDQNEQYELEDNQEHKLQFNWFKLPSDADFYSLHEKRHLPNLGSEINYVLETVEKANEDRLKGIFRSVDFNRIVTLIGSNQSNDLLRWTLEEFNNPDFNLKPSHINNYNISFNVFEFLVSIAPNEHSVGGGEFYTPKAVGILMAKILKPISGETICDPSCGSGALLIRCSEEIDNENYALYGQEILEDSWQICLLNLIFHQVNIAQVGIKLGDTLRNPLQENGKLRQFDAVIANPPIGVVWNSSEANQDEFQRFRRGIPPSSRADYAFILHIIESLKENGRAVILVPHGVLFREGVEGDIRRKIIEENLVEAVIGLPRNLLFGTSTPTAILVINKAKSDQTILFIDGSKEFGKNQFHTTLRDQDIEKILNIFRERKNVPDYAHEASYGEIVENDYNLNVALYIFSIPPIDTSVIRSACPKRYDVFISYSRKDIGSMRSVNEKLRQFGLNVWTDENLEVGTASWQAEIANAIENSCAVVCLLSPDSKVSEWVLKELNYARTHKVKIFPVLINGDIETSVPLVLIDAQYIDLQKQFDNSMESLKTAIFTHTGVRASLPPFLYNLNEIATERNWGITTIEGVVEVAPKLKVVDKLGDNKYPRYSPSGEILEELGYYEYDGDYLLVTRVSSNLKDRNAPIAFKVKGKFSVTANVHVLKAKAETSTEYLVFVLAVTDLRPYIHDATIPSLNRGSLNRVKILLPSLKEQSKIVKYATEELSAIGTIKDKLTKQISLWEANAVNVLRQIFTERI